MLYEVITEKRLDPRNRTYYWQGEDRQSFGNDPQVDGVALSQNFISITPVKCDMTDYRAMEKLARITSYNVCYTKLLRWGAADRSFQRMAAQPSGLMTE